MKRLFRDCAHVGIIVDDAESIAEYFAEELGVGPWHIYDFDHNNLFKKIARGWLQGVPHRGVELELIEPGDNGGLFADFRKEYGNGIQHLCYEFDVDFAEGYEYLQSRFPILLERDLGKTGKYAYFDARESLGYIIEVMDKPLDYERTWLPDRVLYPQGKSVLFECVQAGLPTPSAKDTANLYAEEYGVGPWVVTYTQRADRHISRGWLGGKLFRGFELEYLEKTCYPSALNDFYDQHNGRGIQHICFSVTGGYAKGRDFLKSKLPTLQDGNIFGGLEFTYFDSADRLGFLLEISNFPPGVDENTPGEVIFAKY